MEAKVPLNIKDPATERSARALSAATGEGLTLAVRKAVEERLARVRRDLGGRDTAAELMAIGAHCAALPDLDTREADDIIGYDEAGLPT
jgi:antitoxin VapB